MEEVGYFLPDHIGRLCVHARAIVWVWVCESEQCRTPTWPFSCLDSATKTHATQTHTHNRGAGDHTLTGEWRLKMKSGRGAKVELGKATSDSDTEAEEFAIQYLTRSPTC